MLKQIVFGSFDHPFQDGYKNSIIQILFPWLVQEGYLNHLLQYFLYARPFTKSWCSVGMFFWQMHKLQFHKLVSRCDHLNISTMYSVFDWKEFEILSYRQAFLESTEISASEELNALEKAPAQFMALRILSGKGEVQIMPFRKLSGKCHFLLRFCTSNWSETYTSLFALSAISALLNRIILFQWNKLNFWIHEQEVFFM